MDFLKKLNKEQKKAVVYDDGHLLIVAGAGTGKTTVITNRIAYLIASGKAKYDEILAVTFTDKASEEMQERIDKLLPFGYIDLWVSTFHSFCQRVLQDYGIDIGIPSGFKLLDSTSQWTLMRQNLDKFDLEYYKPAGNPSKFISALLQHFSRAKDEDISPEEYIEYAENIRLNLDKAESGVSLSKSDSLDEVEVSRINEIASAYHTYQKLLLDNNALDFGDLINYTLKLFRKRPKILKHFQNKFKYILIDEFQDTNWSQYELIKMLAGNSGKITVVADDDQSIFKFRGASVSNVMQFYYDYPDAEVVSLVENYRSAQNILDLSYDFIQLNNPERLEVKSLKGKKVNKKLNSNIKEKGDIDYFLYPDSISEAYGVMNSIVDIRKKDRDTTWNDFAVLVRANSQVDDFVAVFENNNIPYQYVASKGLYTKKKVLDIVNYLRVVVDHYDTPSFWYILHSSIFDINHNVLTEITHYAKKKAVSLFESVEYWMLKSDIDKSEREKLKNVLNIIDKGTKLALQSRTRDVVLFFLENSGYLKKLTSEDTEENYQDLKYLEQIDKKIQEFEKQTMSATVKDFLSQIDAEIESGDTGAINFDFDSGPESVKILTIHASKGLEFKYVFMVGMVDKRFPSINRKDPIEFPEDLIKEKLPEGDVHLQEERRLFYVAMTRAKKGLYFTGAENYGGKTKKKPSMFMYDLNMADKHKYVDFKNSLLTHSGLKKDVKDIKDNARARVADKIPSKISFTQFMSYQSCPYQYKLAHISRVPVRSNYTLSFGKTIHNTLRRFLELIKSNESVQQEDLFGNSDKNSLAVPELDILLKFYEEEWIDDWYETADDKEKYRKKGRTMLKEMYKKMEQNPPKPLYLEQGFNLKIKNDKGEEITVYGVIDRIDMLDDGTVEIIDYKTGKPKDSLKSDDKSQLLVYQMAVEEVLGLKPKKLTYYYLENQNPVSFLGSEKDIEKIKSKIFEFYDDLKKSNFEAKPKTSFICSMCDYKNICPYRKGS